MKKPLGLIFSTQFSPIFLHLFSKYYYSFWNSVSMLFETRFAMLPTTLALRTSKLLDSSRTPTLAFEVAGVCHIPPQGATFGHLYKQVHEFYICSFLILFCFC